MDKKHEAKKEMLKMLSKMMSDDSNSGIGEGLKSKKLEKVTVMAPDKKGLVKGLSKAQQIIAAKKGEDAMADEPESKEEALADADSEDMEEEHCPYCDGEGCDECEAMA